MAASRSNHGQCGHKTLGTFGIGNASETILSQHCFGYSTYTGNAEHGGGSTQSIGEWARTHTGVMYRQMFSFEGDKDLPTPVKAILHPSRERFLAVDRGTVRGGNEEAMTELSTVEPIIMPDGWTKNGLRSTLVETCPTRTQSS